MSRYLAVALFVCGLVAQRPDNSRLLTVCELLTSPDKYNGKMVTVRAIVKGTDEGAWLSDLKCPATFRTGSLSWPWAIALASRTQAMKPPDFSFDEQADQQIRQKLLQMNQNNRPIRIWLTYIGRFETHTDLAHAVVRDSNGVVQPAGFGHLNWAPAQLVVKTEKDLDVQFIPQ
jgi:hypothetical protein